MTDSNWEALAEIYLRCGESIADDKEYIFCLCSRVLVKNQTEVVAIEQEELSEAYDVFNEQYCDNHVTSTMNRMLKLEHSHDEDDSDTNSCYYSASAQSHTDNYCTTDEHERDSGADISDYHGIATTSREIFKKPHREENNKSNTSSTGSERERERNNSLPDIFGVKELNDQWEKYWSTNGERLIWSSWIGKYSDFINPAYRNLAIECTADDDEGMKRTEEKSLHTHSNEKPMLTIETMSQHESADTEIVVSICSPGASNCQVMANEANDETTTSVGPLRDLMDSLMLPRCDSVSSSIPLTINTTDSMTNVTNISLSSYGFCSSRISSDNSQKSESTPKSLSPPFHFDDSDETKIEHLSNDDGDDDGDDDADRRWQSLWQRHFQDQYSRHYNDFMETERKPFKACSLSQSFHQDSDGKSSLDEPLKADDDEYNLNEHLTELGLPTSFGRLGGKGNFKRLNARQIDESGNSDRVKAAFSLMGYSFQPNIERNNAATSNGYVVYRKRNIRLHNNMLKMKKKRSDFDYTQFLMRDEAVLSLINDTSSDEADALPPLSNRFDAIDTDSVTNQLLQSDLIGNQSQHTDVFVEKKQMIDLDESKYVEYQQQSKMKIEIGSDANDLKIESNRLESVEETIAVTKNSSKKTKKKRRQNKMLTGLPTEIANDRQLYKYWCKRFSLFSLFDLGIKMDRESWFSVTPEKVAIYTANRCRCDVIVDAFCGAGGNTIQFAKTCRKVIAIDIDPKKIEMAKHNANVYDVSERIEFIVGDYIQLARSLQADVVFLSPPWGGPQYLQQDVYDIEQSLLPLPATQLIQHTRLITPNIAIYLPRNTNTHQLAMLAGPGKSVEIEQGFLDRKLIAITAFYGRLLKNVSN